MVRKKILWLCSWYPGHAEPFNGDFVQRHARSAALYHDIHVIHVFADPSGKIREPVHTVKKQAGLVEEVYEFPKRKGPVSRLFSHMRVLYTYRKLIKGYIKSEGLPDLVHVHVPVWAGMAALWIKRKYKVPYVVTEHWAIYNHEAEDNYLSRSARFKFYTRKIFKGASMFFPVCEYLANGVNEMVFPVKHVTINNSVDSTVFQPGPGTIKGFRFVHVSNMEKRKNVEGIIRAFSRIEKGNKALELCIIGPASPSLKQYAREFGSGIINFTGEISYEEVAENLKSSDALVLFSETENSPCVIGEALCCGLPVISSNAGGIPELLDQTNSILVEPSDENALAEAMKAILNNKSASHAGAISANAALRYSFSAIGKKISDQYELLAK